MSSGIQSLVKILTSTKNRIFLIDCLGALLTAFCLGVVLAQFEKIFGMPKSILCSLAAAACVFAIYSLCCYFFVSGNYKSYLKGIAIANFLYLCTTIVLIFAHYQSLTGLGLGYFLIELIVVGCLIVVEFKIVSATKNKV